MYFEQPVDGERHHAEHQMSEYFLRASNANSAGSKLIFKPGVGSLNGCSLFVSLLFGRRHFRGELHTNGELGLRLGPGVRLDDGLMVELDTGFSDGGVIGGVHHVIEIGDPIGGDMHEWNRHLGIVNTGRGQQRGDGNPAISEIEMEFLATPVDGIASAAGFGADVAVF